MKIKGWHILAITPIRYWHPEKFDVDGLKMMILAYGRGKVGMKQFFTISLAVFLGSLGAHLVERHLDILDAENATAMAARKTETDQLLKEKQGKILREIFQKGGRGGVSIPNPDEPSPPLPAGWPDGQP